MKNLILLTLLICPLATIQAPQEIKTDSNVADCPVMAEECLFEEAVECIKKFEGWHTKKNHPYVGYGHKLLPGERFDSEISEEFADSLLRKDLLQKCKVFRSYGKDSLILGVLAYNVGEYNLLGTSSKKKSKLIRKLESNNRDIYHEYISFRKYKGKIISSIEKRRIYEYHLLFDKVKYK